jgi:8-oxo-dGTP diphosphatase
MSRERTSRVVSIAVVHDGHLLVLRRSSRDSFAGYWETPGGGVKGRETHAEAAVRELAEETGIAGAEIVEIERTVRPPLLPGSVNYNRVDEAGFLVRVPARPPVHLNPSEHDNYRWVDAAEIDGLQMAGPKRALALRALRFEGPR